MNPELVGRQTELSDLRRAIASQGGAVLIGPAGVGKTRLARESVESSDFRWVATTADAATIPYGPLVAALPGMSPGLAPRAAIEAIRRGVADVETLVIDDAHLLDVESAALVHHLAVEGAVSVLATIRLGEATPEPVTALWKDVGLARFDIGPLEWELAAELTQNLLGGPAGPHLLDTIWARSQGHPLEIRELVLSARELDLLDRVDDQWVLTGELTPTHRITDLVEARLSRLSDAERDVADLLAYSEGTDISLLVELAERTVVDDLERSGIAINRSDGASGSVLQLAHPLYGEVLRARLPAARRREMATLLAGAARSAAGGIDPLRLGTWRFEAGLADAEELAATGRIAYGRGAYALALRLGSASLAREESYRAHVVVGAALAEHGRRDEAEPHFRRAQDVAPNRLLGAWALLGYAWYLFAELPDEALDLMREEIAEEEDPEVATELSAGLALLLALYGDYETANAMTSEILDGGLATDQARLLALVTKSRADLAALRPDDSLATVDSAWDTVDRARSALPNAEDLLLATAAVSDLVNCQPEEALRRVEERLRAGPEVDEGLWRHLSGRLQLRMGDAHAAYRSQLSAIRLLERSDPGFTLPLAIAEAAHATAVLGYHEHAVSLLESIAPARAGAPNVRLAAGYVLALVRATTESIDDAAVSAVEVGDEAADLGDTLHAADAWHLAVRLGHPDLVVGRLRRCAEETAAPIVRLYAEHADRLATGDVEGLEAVGHRFAQKRLGLFAVEVLAQAAEHPGATDEDAGAPRHRAVARKYLGVSSGVQTPALRGIVDSISLTEREREVAFLAASGLSSRSIAGQLHISGRTVDNHLGSVYAKLGVAGRGELADVLAV